MFPFEHHRYVLRSGDPSDLIDDLLAQSFLQLQAIRANFERPSTLSLGMYPMETSHQNGRRWC